MSRPRRVAADQGSPVNTVDLGDLPQHVALLLDLVDSVPPGRVTSYGRLAAALERVGPRHVGALMARYGHLTCWWRVVDASGRLPGALAWKAEPHWRAEATPLADGRTPRVLIARAAWNPPVPR